MLIVVGVIEGNCEMGSWKIESSFIKIIVIDKIIVNIGFFNIF